MNVLVILSYSQPGGTDTVLFHSVAATQLCLLHISKSWGNTTQEMCIDGKKENVPFISKLCALVWVVRRMVR